MTVLLDGGLATTLQRDGLPPFSPVEPWVLGRPEAVEAAQRDFVEAGAQVLLTATFRGLPHLTPRWGEVADSAVALAIRAAADRAEVWASIGPVSTPRTSWRLADAAAVEGFGALARRCVDGGARGVALETFVDAEELLVAVERVRAVTSVPLAACLCPREDGRLWDGSEPLPWLHRLVDAGATIVGFNCGAGPASILAAVGRSEGARAPLWAKPNRGEADPQGLVEVLLALGRTCRYVGGCCGVGPDVIARVAAGFRAAPPS